MGEVSGGSSSVKAEETITSVAVQIFPRSQLSEGGGDEEIFAVFASTENGTIYAWYLSPAEVNLKPIPTRRRPTFNPFRLVHAVLGAEELTTRRRISRSYQPKGVEERMPDMRWKAHSEGGINCLNAIGDGSFSLVSSSSDCTARIWSCSGELLGQLDLNEPGGEGVGGEVNMWKFHGSAGVAADKLENTKDSVWRIEPIGKHSANSPSSPSHKPKLLRHESQENFLNQTLHHSKVHVHRKTLRKTRIIREKTLHRNSSFGFKDGRKSSQSLQRNASFLTEATDHTATTFVTFNESQTLASGAPEENEKENNDAWRGGQIPE